MTDDRLSRTLARFDAENAEDPHFEEVGGARVPKELLYGRRMSERLEAFAPNAPEVVRLAARSQHLRRWEIPRNAYETNRAGYLAWRTALGKLHAERASAIAREEGYDEALVERLATILRKRGLKTDPEVQLLEDVICLVFLEHYFADFAAQHEDEKVISILQKTWGKMSEAGHAAALKLPLAGRPLDLVRRALAG